MLQELGHEVFVAKLRAIYTSDRKSDKNDARMTHTAHLRARITLASIALAIALVPGSAFAVEETVLEEEAVVGEYRE